MSIINTLNTLGTLTGTTTNNATITTNNTTKKEDSTMKTIETAIQTASETVREKAYAIAEKKTAAIEQLNLSGEDKIADRLADGARTVTKCDKVALGGYKLWKIPQSALLACLNDKDGTIEEKIGAIDTMLNSTRIASIERGEAYGRGDYAEADNLADKIRVSVVSIITMLNSIEAGLQSKLDSGMPLTVAQSACRIGQAQRSQAAEIAGVCFDGRQTSLIAVADHNFEALLGNKLGYLQRKFSKNYRFNFEAKAASITKLLLKILVRNGIKIGSIAYKVWASTSSQQKTGSVYLGEVGMMDRTADVRACLGTMDEINNAGGDSGANYLKRQALFFTPSDIWEDKDGRTIALDEVLMMDDIVLKRTAKKVLHITNDAEALTEEDKKLVKTMFDGQAISFVKSFTSAQMRGLFMKMFAVSGYGIIAAMKKAGVDFPKTVQDIDGVEHDLSKVKMVMTKSCWKADKLGITWTEFVARANELAVKYPGINALRVVRYSDSADEKEHTLTRQAVQQFLCITHDEIAKMTARGIRKANSLKTASGALVKLAGLTKTDEERSALEFLFERFPGLMAAPQVQQTLRQNFDLEVANSAAGRVPVDSQYPYIAQDPIAMIQILILGMDPNSDKLGLLREDEVNIPNASDGEEFFAIRYPANHIVGMVLRNRNFLMGVDVGGKQLVQDPYAGIGAVAVLSYYGFAIDRADGDFDGDEMSFVRDQVVVEVAKRNIAMCDFPLITFDHAKAKNLKKISSFDDLSDEIADTLYNAQHFNRVGQYSNLAAKLMVFAAKAPTAEARRNALINVAFAHVGTILVIDMIKTGFMPEAIEKKLEALNDGLRMPWNQRFNKSTIIEPYYSASWNEKVEPQTNYVCDELAAHVMRNVGSWSFDAEGLTFDIHDLLTKERKHQAQSGFVTRKLLARLHAVNYDKDTAAMLVKIQKALEASEAGKTSDEISNRLKIKPSQLMQFFFRNCAAMARIMNPDSGEDRAEKYSYAEQLKFYYQFVRDTLVDMQLDSTTAYFKDMDAQARINVLVNHFILDAFGNPVQSDTDGKYAMFVLRVFANDILNAAV